MSKGDCPGSCASVEVVASQIKAMQEDIKTLKTIPAEQSRQDERLNSHSKTLERFGPRIETLEEKVTKNSGTSRVMERVGFLFLAAGVGAVAKYWG